jgi:general secretion pathway protein K
VSARRQRGSALILAMLVVVAALTLVSGALWQQNALVREAENELAYAQARWLLRGAIDWAGVILQEDARSTSVDHPGEAWSVPLADTRLNPEDGRTPAYLAGAIEDEQGKLNLRNLVTPDGLSGDELEALRRLLATLRIDGAFAERIAERVARAVRERGERAAPALAFVDDALAVGMDKAAAERLRPFVTVLPEVTALNVNTAAPEVLSARIAALDLGDARGLVAGRDRAYFRDLADARDRLANIGVQTSGAGLAVGTRYFRVSGLVTYGPARLGARALLKRDGARFEVLWMKESA